jgi:hypothetical protein
VVGFAGLTPVPASSWLGPPISASKVLTGVCVLVHRYQITVRGELGAASREAFDGMTVHFSEGRTVMVGDLDQATLYSVVFRIYDLAFELVSVVRVDP